MKNYDQLTPREIEQEIYYNWLKYAEPNEREDMQ